MLALPSKVAVIVPAVPETTSLLIVASGIKVNLLVESSYPKNHILAAEPLCHLKDTPLSLLSSELGADVPPKLNIGSAIVTVVLLTVVVVPPTVKLPGISTVVLEAPIVNVFAPTVSKIVLLPAVKSKSVNAVKAVIVPPSEVAVPPIVIALFANSALATPAVLIVTTPLETAKLSEWNEAIPLLEVEAFSPEKVTVPELSATSKPSPAANVAVPPNAIAVLLEPSVTVIVFAVKDPIPMLVSVLDAPLIVLFVNVSVVSLATNVLVPVGIVTVPELEILEIAGSVNALFVSVSLPASVANVPVVGNVILVVPVVVKVNA